MNQVSLRAMRELNKLIDLRDKLLETVKYVEKVTLELINRVEADLIIVNFPSTHLGGHKFWDMSCITEDLSEIQRNEFENSLKLIYSRCDESLGNILASIKQYSYLFVFSLHGMGPNTNRSQILQEMVNKILGLNTQNNSPGILQQIRKLIPLGLRNRIKAGLPWNVQDFLTLYWRNKPNWDSFEIIPIEMDLQGFIRFNLKNIHKQCKRCNREMSGNIVEYRKRLIVRIGLEEVEGIENDSTIKRFDKEYLERIKTIFSRKARLLDKRRG